MSDDLVAWLRAQLDEDERLALAASPGPWKSNAEHDEVMAADDITVAEGFALSGNQLRATVDHIVRWDPARALAEVDAKRRIIDMHQPSGSAGTACLECSGEYHDEPLPCPTLRLLALPYAEKEGYRPEWRPDTP